MQPRGKVSNPLAKLGTQTKMSLQVQSAACCLSRKVLSLLDHLRLFMVHRLASLTVMEVQHPLNQDVYLAHLRLLNTAHCNGRRAFAADRRIAERVTKASGKIRRTAVLAYATCCEEVMQRAGEDHIADYMQGRICWKSPDPFAIASAADGNVRNAHGLPLPDVTTLPLFIGKNCERQAIMRKGCRTLHHP